MEPLIDKLQKHQFLYLYDDRFIEFLEMNLATLQQSSINKSMEMQVSDVDRFRAKNNFNLLCNIAGVPYELHWVTMRVNGYKEYSEFKEHDGPLYLTDTEHLAMLKLKFDESQTNI